MGKRLNKEQQENKPQNGVWEWVKINKRHHGRDMSCLGVGMQGKHIHILIHADFVTQGQARTNGQQVISLKPLFSSSQAEWQSGKNRPGLKSVQTKEQEITGGRTQQDLPTSCMPY